MRSVNVRRALPAGVPAPCAPIQSCLAPEQQGPLLKKKEQQGRGGRHRVPSAETCRRGTSTSQLFRMRQRCRCRPRAPGGPRDYTPRRQYWSSVRRARRRHLHLRPRAPAGDTIQSPPPPPIHGPRSTTGAAAPGGRDAEPEPEPPECWNGITLTRSHSPSKKEGSRGTHSPPRTAVARPAPRRPPPHVNVTATEGN